MYRDDILFEFQKEVVNLAKPNFLYALDTGTGKSLVALHHYLKHYKGEPLLIIAPPAKVKEGGWEEEVKFVEEKYNIEIEHETMSSGMLAKRWEDYKGWFVVFDEAHQFKNPTSKRGKAAHKLSQASTHFLLLTATPMSNGWEDSYNYFIMFGFYKNKTQMNKRHAIYQNINMGGRIIPKIVEWQREDELKEKYKSFTVSISKDDALDLPPVMYKKINFPKSKDYRTLEKDRVLNDEAYDTVPKLLHGLRYHANQKDKLKWIEMFLESTESNVLIFYQYKEEFEELEKITSKLSKKVYAVNGQRKELPQKKKWSELKNTVTLVQYQAGSSGIELQFCSEVIFYTPTYSYQDYTQALGRADRQGQKKKITVYQFETKGTIESAVWGALYNKKDFDTQLYAITKLGVN